MNIERLNHLITILERVQNDPKEKAQFDMNFWINYCGTSACAVGFACLDPVFQAQGLKIRDNEPKFQDFYSYSAAAKFFEITCTEVRYLFSPVDYGGYSKIEPVDVIDRIRKLINNQTKTGGEKA